MRQDDLSRRQAVGVALVRVSADTVEEPPELARRVMELSGARPSVGPREDGAITVLGDDPSELACDQPVGLVPRDRDERLGAAFRTIGPRAALEPPLAHHRLRNATRIVEGIHHAVGDGRGVGIVLETVHGGQSAIAHLGAVRPPVGHCQGQVPSRHVRRFQAVRTWRRWYLQFATGEASAGGDSSAGEWRSPSGTPRRTSGLGPRIHFARAGVRPPPGRRSRNQPLNLKTGSSRPPARSSFRAASSIRQFLASGFRSPCEVRTACRATCDAVHSSRIGTSLPVSK